MKLVFLDSRDPLRARDYFCVCFNEQQKKRVTGEVLDFQDEQDKKLLTPETTQGRLTRAEIKLALQKGERVYVQRGVLFYDVGLR